MATPEHRQLDLPRSPPTLCFIFTPFFLYFCSSQEFVGETNINKRGRDDDEADDDPEAPDKKRPTNGMTATGFEGLDPPAGGFDGQGGATDPAGGPSGADVSPCFVIFSLIYISTYSDVFLALLIAGSTRSFFFFSFLL
jgi:hypothetical protein